MTRINFSQPLWIVAAGHLVGMAAMVFAAWQLFAGLVPVWWAVVWAVVHVICALALSVGLHRYFSHAAFTTSPFWHKAMAWASILVAHGSPQGWAAAHCTHHRWSDTDRDPHIDHWTYIFYKRYRAVPMLLYRVKKLTGDPTLEAVHRYGGLVWVLLVLTLSVLSLALGSSNLLVYGYLAGLGSVNFVGAFHQVFSHKNLQPRDIWWMELVLPVMGEWLHGTHHKYQKRADFRTRRYHLDPGYWFVKLIRSDT